MQRSRVVGRGSINDRARLCRVTTEAWLMETTAGKAGSQPDG